MVVYATETEEDLIQIKSYFFNDWDSARLLAKNLLDRSEEKEDSYGIVKSNLYLGYILYEQKDFGKSVLYCLEGIRQADKRNYDGIHKDKIWLRRNIANTFRQFEANQLATKYNLEAIQIAEEFNIVKQIIDLKYNQGLVYQNSEAYEDASRLLSEIVPLLNDNIVYKSEIINQIGMVHFENNDYDQAKTFFNQLINAPEEAALFKAKALHNLGEIDYENGQTTKSIDKLYSAIKIMESIEGIEYSLFISYRNIGRYLFEVGKTGEALNFLNKAEAIASFAEHDASSFKIYKTFSNIYYSKGMDNLGKKYSEIFFEKTEKFLETQRDIQRKDREYNFDLIAKRYFDEVEKQERIASILFYSKTISGSLLFLLLLTIGYNRYQKVQLRKSLVQELVELKVID